MLLSPATVEYGKQLNEQYCDGCRIAHLPGKHLKLEDVDRNYITQVFVSTGRNITKTAAILDIARSTLHNKLDQYGLR